jgi:hypothetical protein
MKRRNKCEKAFCGHFVNSIPEAAERSMSLCAAVADRHPIFAEGWALYHDSGEVTWIGDTRLGATDIQGQASQP